MIQGAHIDDFDPAIVGYECDGPFLAEVWAMQECGDEPPDWYCQLKPDCGAKHWRDCPAIKRRRAVLASWPIIATWNVQ